MRTSEYQQPIFEVLEKHHLLTMAQIHEQIPNAHFASIYRNVEALCKKGIVKKVVVGKKNIQYELASHSHGHFVCDDCDDVSEFEVPKAMYKTHGKISDVVVRGTCDDCGEK